MLVKVLLKSRKVFLEHVVTNCSLRGTVIASHVYQDMFEDIDFFEHGEAVSKIHVVLFRDENRSAWSAVSKVEHPDHTTVVIRNEI